MTRPVELPYQGPLCKFMLIRWWILKGAAGVISVSLDPGILVIDYLFIHEQIINS